MKFQQTFDRIYRQRRSMQLLSTLLRWVTLVMGIWFVYGLLDLILQLDSIVRLVAGCILAITLTLLLILSAAKAAAITRSRVAREIDREGNDRRETAQCSINLADNRVLSRHDNEQQTEWLKRQSLDQAAALLDGFSWKGSTLRKHLWRRNLKIGIPLILPLLACIILLPEIFSITFVQRIFMPLRDIPPWTPMTFAISPDPARVIYGDDLVIKAELGNEPATADIDILIRNNNLPVQRFNTYREGKNSHSRRLEKMTANCEIAFETATRWGKARSHWHPVTVAMQPKIVSGEVLCRPPAYIRREPERMPLSGMEIPVHEGGVVEYRLKSNRALSRAFAVYHPAREELERKHYTAEIIDPTTALFRIPVRHSGRVSFQLVDHDGSQMERPLESKVRVTVDQRPAIKLISPATVSIVDPSVVIPLQFEVTDDHELIRVDLYRQINNSRERAKPFLQRKGDATCLVMEQLPMTALGAQPGDVISLYLEARDSNPYALNIATSDIIKIHVLTEEQCIDLLRMQTSVNDFMDQYNALAEAYEKTIEALDRAIEEQDANKIAELMDQATRAAQKLDETSRKLAENTIAFETDKNLRKLTDQIVETTSLTLAELAQARQMKAGGNEQKEALKTMRSRLRKKENEIQSAHEQAAGIARMAALFEQLMALRELTGQQTALQQSLKQYDNELRNNRRVTRDQLQTLAREERDIADKIEQAVSQLGPLAAVLPLSEEKLKREIDKLIQQYKQSGARELLLQTEQHAHAGRHHRAMDTGAQALDILKKLFGDDSVANPDNFMACADCQGMSQAARQAMEQLIRALCDASGDGSGISNGLNSIDSGIGAGGHGRGSSLGGRGSRSGAHINMPGTVRNHPRPEGSAGRQGQGQGESDTGTRGQAGAAPAQTIVRGSETRPDNEANSREQEQGMGGQDVRETPAPYREAVKKYFSEINQEQ